jgi:hypothetical protein
LEHVSYCWPGKKKNKYLEGIFEEILTRMDIDGERILGASRKMRAPKHRKMSAETQKDER